MTKFTSITFVAALMLLILNVEAKEERKFYDALIGLCSAFEPNTKEMCEAVIKYEDFKDAFIECQDERDKPTCIVMLTNAILMEPEMIKEMTPKAKATIVVVAASVWSKLQQAYVLETDKIGDAIKIGYTPPNGTKPSNDGSDTYFTYKTEVRSGMAVFYVKNKKKLGGCPIGSEWKVIGKLSKSDITFDATPPKNTKCTELTPDFKDLKY